MELPPTASDSWNGISRPYFHSDVYYMPHCVMGGADVMVSKNMEDGDAARFVRLNPAIINLLARSLILDDSSLQLREVITSQIMPPMEAAGWMLSETLQSLWSNAQALRGLEACRSLPQVSSLDSNSLQLLNFIIAASSSPLNLEGNGEIALALVENTVAHKATTGETETRGAEAAGLSTNVSQTVPQTNFKSIDYYASRPANRTTMLGGIDHVHEEDARGSLAFIDVLRSTHGRPASGIVLDCGAGIGRVSDAVLLARFSCVELVEPNAAFLEKASESLPNGAIHATHLVSLEEFRPSPSSKYAAVWAQWVLGYLDDDQLKSFLERCAQALLSDGVIFVKESVIRGDGNAPHYDERDGSHTRSDAQFRACFAQAGLQIIVAQLEEGFPPELFPVWMYALAPQSPFLV